MNSVCSCSWHISWHPFFRPFAQSLSRDLNFKLQIPSSWFTEQSMNIGAVIVTYTNLGIPYYNYSIIYPQPQRRERERYPQPYANHYGPYSMLKGGSRGISRLASHRPEPSSRGVGAKAQTTLSFGVEP